MKVYYSHSLIVFLLSLLSGISVCGDRLSDSFSVNGVFCQDCQTVKHAKMAKAGIEFVNSQRERNVLFNDALNTFYLRLYGVRHMVKDHSDSERGNPLPPHRLLFPISSKGSFICTIPQTG